MTLRERLSRLLVGFLVERPAQGRTLAQLAQELEGDGHKIEERLRAASDSASNRHQLRHIIGMERWGQQRLRVLLGEALTLDEYDGYQPDETAPWDKLRTAFQATRQGTIALARELEQADVSARTVPHNQFGELSARGWLFYLKRHATMEAIRFKK